MIEPKNEQGVIVLFSQICYKWNIEIIDIRTEFPDAVIKKDNKEYKVEFEFVSSNFIKHNHDDSHCDIIICWKNDLEFSPLPVIELSTKKIEFDSDYRQISKFWRMESKKLEKKLKYREKEKLEFTKSTSIQTVRCPDCETIFQLYPYSCKYCGRSFSKPQGLNGHIGRCKQRRQNHIMIKETK